MHLGLRLAVYGLPQGHLENAIKSSPPTLDFLLGRDTTGDRGFSEGRIKVGEESCCSREMGRWKGNRPTKHS